MYMYDHKKSGVSSFKPNHAVAPRTADHNSYYSNQVISRFLGNSGAASFSSVCDASTATPGFSSTERSKLVGLLTPIQSTQAIQQNQQTHPGRSGIRPEDILVDLSRYVDLSAVQAAIQSSGVSYPANPGPLNAVFVEAVHQFQAKIFFDPKKRDGQAGPSTLDSLGIVKHRLKPKIGDVHGRSFLKDHSDEIRRETNEFDSKNWYDFLVTPSFLGHQIDKYPQGIHILLLRKLREAERYLLSLPAYAGKTPVELGRALGLDRSSVYYSGGRISKEPQSFHGFGLALDIDVTGNPWIGAGWITESTAANKWLIDQLKTNQDQQTRNKYQRLLDIRNERYRLMEVLKAANSGPLRSVPKGTTIFAFLRAIAVSYGQDTRAAYEYLARRNEEFKSFLRNHPSELLHWKNGATFARRDPLNGFLNLHGDLVFALRQHARLAWGAIDFRLHSGDIMHFDMRTLGVWKKVARSLGAAVPEAMYHPIGLSPN
jgi:hypothetical protein